MSSKTLEDLKGAWDAFPFTFPARNIPVLTIELVPAQSWHMPTAPCGKKRYWQCPYDRSFNESEDRLCTSCRSKARSGRDPHIALWRDSGLLQRLVQAMSAQEQRISEVEASGVLMPRWAGNTGTQTGASLFELDKILGEQRLIEESHARLSTFIGSLLSHEKAAELEFLISVHRARADAITDNAFEVLSGVAVLWSAFQKERQHVYSMEPVEEMRSTFYAYRHGWFGGNPDEYANEYRIRLLKSSCLAKALEDTLEWSESSYGTATPATIDEIGITPQLNVSDFTTVKEYGIAEWRLHRRQVVDRFYAIFTEKLTAELDRFREVPIWVTLTTTNDFGLVEGGHAKGPDLAILGVFDHKTRGKTHQFKVPLEVAERFMQEGNSLGTKNRLSIDQEWQCVLDSALTLLAAPNMEDVTTLRKAWDMACIIEGVDADEPVGEPHFPGTKKKAVASPKKVKNCDTLMLF